LKAPTECTCHYVGAVETTAPPESTPEELFVFWLLDYRIDNRDEAEEAHSRCYLHATHTKDVVIENMLVASATAHEYKTEDDNQHSDYHQNEVNLAKCVISFIHFVFILN
jgi:hypothetical protein